MTLTGRTENGLISLFQIIINIHRTSQVPSAVVSALVIHLIIMS